MLYLTEQIRYYFASLYPTNDIVQEKNNCTAIPCFAIGKWIETAAQTFLHP